MAAIGAQMGSAGPLPTPVRPKDRSRSAADFSVANLEEIGRSSGPFSESRPTLIGLTSRATAVASMQVY